MTFIENIAEFYNNSENITKEETPKGVCPNCWGTQEYDGKVRKLFKDHQIDVNNKKAKYSFIQGFVVTYLDGIRLKKRNNNLECSTCNK